MAGTAGERRGRGRTLHTVDGPRHGRDTVSHSKTVAAASSLDSWLSSKPAWPCTRVTAAFLLAHRLPVFSEDSLCLTLRVPPLRTGVNPGGGIVMLPGPLPAGRSSGTRLPCPASHLLHAHPSPCWASWGLTLQGDPQKSRSHPHSPGGNWLTFLLLGQNTEHGGEVDSAHGFQCFICGQRLHAGATHGGA